MKTLEINISDLAIIRSYLKEVLNLNFNVPVNIFCKNTLERLYEGSNAEDMEYYTNIINNVIPAAYKLNNIVENLNKFIADSNVNITYSTYSDN